MQNMGNCKRARPKFRIGDILERFYLDVEFTETYLVIKTAYDLEYGWLYELMSYEDKYIREYGRRYVDTSHRFRRIG